VFKEAEIANQFTGTVYFMPYEEKTAVHNFLGRIVNVANPTFSRTGTGEDVRTFQLNDQFSPHQRLVHLSTYASTTTGYELLDTSTFLSLLMPNKLFNYEVADYYTAFEVKSLVSSKPSLSTHLADTANIDLVDTPAERLRTVSGLKPGQLVEIFQVTRPTYYKWISGAIPHGTHREHLLEVLPLVEEAFRRLGNQKSTSDWLLTPVTPNGKKPVDYLKARQYSVFRGFLLRARTGQEIIKPITSSHPIHRELSREETEDTLERLSPKAWKEDFDMDEITF